MANEEEGQKTVLDQIDDMLNIGIKEPEPEPPVEEPPVEEPPVEEPPKEEPPAEEPPVEEPPAEPPVEEPPVEPPKEEPPPEPEPEDELTRLKRENESLRGTIDKISGPKQDEPAEPAEPVEPTPTPAPAAEQAPAPKQIEEIDFLGDADIDDITRDPAALNKLLNKVYVQGNASREVLGEEILRSIPTTVKKTVETVVGLKEMSDKFYTDNEDLKPFKKVVAAVFEELGAANPDKRYDELLPEVETESRKRLELYREVNTPERKVPRLPRVGSQPRETHTKPKTDQLTSEIDAMNKVIY